MNNAHFPHDQRMAMNVNKTAPMMVRMTHRRRLLAMDNSAPSAIASFSPRISYAVSESGDLGAGCKAMGCEVVVLFCRKAQAQRSGTRKPDDCRGWSGFGETPDKLCHFFFINCLRDSV